MRKLKLITKESEESIDIREEDIDMTFFDNINEENLAKATGGKICMRTVHEFKGKAIRLSLGFDYKLGTDSDNTTILVPLKKK